MSTTTERHDAGEARRQHRNAWLGTLAIGAAFIGLSNLFSWGPWLVATVLSALMIMFGLSVRSTDVSSDSKGDSVYYLGLLFTFIALAAALVTSDWASDTTETTGIIRNFGIALFTTIVGLAGRVWYAMSGDAPGDMEEAIRSDLEHAVSEMKGTLDRARDHLDILVDTFVTSSDAMATTVERIFGTTDKAAETAEVLDQQANRVAGTVESLAGCMVAFDDAVEDGTKAVRGLQVSVGEIGGPFASLGEQLASAGVDVRDFRSVLAEARRATEPVSQAIRESADGVATVAAETASLRGTITGLLRRAQATDGLVEKIGHRAQEAGRHVQSTLEEAKRRAVRGSDNLQDLTAEASAVGEAFASIRKSAGTARDGIADVAEGAQALEEQVTAIDARRLSESIGSARRRGDELSSALSTLRDQSGEFSRIMVTASEEVEQLSKETRDARRKIRSRRIPARLLQRVRGIFSRRRNRVPDSRAR